MMPTKETEDVFSIFHFLEVRSRVLSESKGEGIYSFHCFLNHSCIPNAIVVNPSDFPNASVVVQALEPIQEGEEITISYIDETMSKEKRKELLSTHYLFDCKCAKCRKEE